MPEWHSWPFLILFDQAETFLLNSQPFSVQTFIYGSIKQNILEPIDNMQLILQNNKLGSY